jgi:hypothetical protein
MSDFVPSSPKSNEEDDEEEVTDKDSTQQNGELNLYILTFEFLGYLRRVEGMPYAKGELGRRELYRFIIDRHFGKLEYRESMLPSTVRDINRQEGRRTKPIKKYRRYKNLLVPDPQRLDHYLAGLRDIMNQLYHRASAFFEIIPSWLRFLEIKSLIDTEMRIKAIDNLAYLTNSLSRIFDRYGHDPVPRQALAGWRGATKAQ